MDEFALGETIFHSDNDVASSSSAVRCHVAFVNRKYYLIRAKGQRCYVAG